MSITFNQTTNYFTYPTLEFFMKIENFKTNCVNNDDDRSAALSHILRAWEVATDEGIDASAIAHAALFTALIDLVSAYGEDAVALLTEQIPERVRGGDYTLERNIQ